MPWGAAWPVVACTACLYIVSLLIGALAVGTSQAAIRRFGSFYRGDISAFLAERWQVSLVLVPAGAMMFFLCSLCRHPLHSPTGALEPLNQVAVVMTGFASLGIAGVGVFTQKDNTGTSRYPLQCDTMHGAFMFLGFGGVFSYECLHTGVLLQDALVGSVVGGLAFWLANLELLLTVATAVHFGLWLLATSKEEYPDDPKCSKHNEWLAVLCVLGYMATLPLLMGCLQGPTGQV